MVRRTVGADGRYDTSHSICTSITIVTIIHRLGKTQWGREAAGHDIALRAEKKRTIPRTPQKCVTGQAPPRGAIGGARPDTASAGSASSASSSSSSYSRMAMAASPPRGGAPAPPSVMAMAGQKGRLLEVITVIGLSKRRI